MSFFSPEPPGTHHEFKDVAEAMQWADTQQKQKQASIPSPVGASTTALQNQITKEQNARATASILTSAAGLHDEPTTTASLLTGT